MSKSKIVYDLATDNGPKCAGCTGTCWRYGKGRYVAQWVAQCAACNMVEGPIHASHDAAVADVRKAHELLHEPEYKEIEDVEYQVSDRYFKTFDKAAAYAVISAFGRGTATIDVLIWSRKGAAAYGGNDAVERYNEDPEASVFERLEIKVVNQGMVP